MGRKRGAVTVAVLLVLGLGVAGCSGGDDDEGSGKAQGSPSPTAAASVKTVDEALDAYRAASAAGCTTAPECQDLMTAELAAAVDVRTAMAAKDKALYAEPIGLVDLAEERADHYGRDNLGAKGSSYAVTRPLQDMLAWFGAHPEG